MAKREAQITTQIFRAKHPTRKPSFTLSRSGFTLIEVLIVVALIGLLTYFALPSVSSYFKQSMNTASRELASLIKQTYNSTVVTGLVHRMAYDIDNHQYWVEVATSQTVLLDTAETRKKEEDKKSRIFGGTKKKKKDPFQLAEDITRKKMKLPDGVQFEDLETEIIPEPINSGIVYSHFFPQGATEQTVIHIKDRQDRKITLIISSLLGRTKLEQGYLKKDDIFKEK